MSALVYIYIVYNLYAYIVEIRRFQSTMIKNVNQNLKYALGDPKLNTANTKYMQLRTDHRQNVECFFTCDNKKVIDNNC